MSAASQPVQETIGAFLGLKSYTEANSNSFFGRDNEIDSTTSLIQLNTLTIVFGRSGTGKTSLLNAGVFPKLRKNYCLPFRIRLEFNKTSAHLVTQVKNVLKREIDNYGFNVQTYPGEETLWEYFHKELLWVSITPILVFDQFEEIFTLAKTDPRWANEMPAFWEELSDLIENNIPKKLEYQFLNHREQITYNYKAQRTKIVFSFREEYLPEFESITSKIPSLKYSRFRLLPMNGNQAYDVITKTWKENINPSEANHIVSYFTNEPGLDDYSLLTVEPSLLSQVCTYIDKERIENGGGKVSADLLKKYPKETILRTIYEEAVTAANEKLPGEHEHEKKNAANLVKIFLEEKLITSEGYRTKYNLGSNDETLRPAINVLTARYFLREDDNAVELTHDVVAPIIKTDREKRRKDTAFARLRKRVAIIAALLVLLGLGALAYFTNATSKAWDQLSSLKSEIKDSTEALKSLNNTISELRKKYPPGQKPGPNNHDDPDKESDAQFWKDSVEKLNTKNSVLVDSVELLGNRIGELNLKIGNASRIQVQTAAALQTANDQIVILRRQARSDGEKIESLNQKIDGLNNGLVLANEKIRVLRDSVRYLTDMNKKLNATMQELLNRNPGSTFPGNLRIQVYDKSGETKIPITKDTFLVYIIPNSGTNEKILEENKNILFTKDCGGFNTMLSKLNSWQKAYFKDGYYYFHDIIQNGKYKIKICNILDGYFNLKMPSPSGEVYWKQNEKQKIAIKLGRF